MHEVGRIGFDVYFSKLPDPRISRKKLYLSSSDENDQAISRFYQ